jgi:hypothetical protein
MRDLAQRVADRYAARALNVPPMKLDPCKNCGGEGMHVEKSLQVKNLCVRCFGTGTDPKALGTLREETTKLGEQFQKDYAAFEKERKPYRGRSVRQFGVGQGYDLQTLRITWTARQEQLKNEEARLDMGKQMARIAGAAAR